MYFQRLEHVRPADWQIGAWIQQELMPRMSVEVGYFRRWLTNFTTTDDESLIASDFDSFSFTAPASIHASLAEGAMSSTGCTERDVGRLCQSAQQQHHVDEQLRRPVEIYNGVLINFSAR